MKKDDPKLSWEEKQKIENALDKYQELQDKVDKVNDQLGDMKQNLQENNLLSKETMEKYVHANPWKNGLKISAKHVRHGPMSKSE